VQLEPVPVVVARITGEKDEADPRLTEQPKACLEQKPTDTLALNIGDDRQGTKNDRGGGVPFCVDPRRAEQGVPDSPTAIKGDEREQGVGAGISDQVAHERRRVLASEGDATDRKRVLQLRS